MPDMHLWGKCASTKATYEVAPINNVARITVQSTTTMMMMMMMMTMPQPNYIY